MVALRLLTATTLILAAVALPTEYVGKTFDITVQNLAYLQPFSPVLAVIHEPSIYLFQLGTPASAALRAVAEGGDPSKFVALFQDGLEGICGWSVAPGKTLPSTTYKGTVTISKPCTNPHISIVNMLGITNDAFTGINTIPLYGELSKRFEVPAYDAGTEENNEDCQYVFGCPGSPNLDTPGLGEGFVHVHRGVHGLNVSKPGLSVDYDWRNPVAYITVSVQHPHYLF
ncbi:hypothetical protein BC937DRAFT_87135 [Endogone sp. FLAS-F59071]|nr:hypothetical protein BC937DRAFT_87135 [Endogone sp. FLAS-F59071]|eukprot:RUS19665.1 hypothetical protein BC937DRAFT_87135 [Endogone sp. FLAS-F59071]